MLRGRLDRTPGAVSRVPGARRARARGCRSAAFLRRWRGSRGCCRRRWSYGSSATTQSGSVYGGNKVRKLEFLLGEAKQRGARRLVTLGAIGSHHVLATAIYGRQAGFDVDAVVFPQPLTAHVREQMLADVAAGATLYADARLSRRALARLAATARRRRAVDRIGRLVADGHARLRVGGPRARSSRSASGALPRPDVIYVALGSCGTAAGLLVGLAGAPSLPRLDARVVGVRVVDRAVSNEHVTRQLAARTARAARRARRPMV